MTEMEELKKNTDKALAEQRFASVFEWMSTIEKKWEIALVEAGKNLRWMYVVAILQLVVVFFSPLSILFFLLLCVLLLRQHKINEEIEYQKGLLMGTHKTLFLLGMTDRDIEDEINKRMNRRRVVSSSPFKRFKELFERLGSKNKQEAHAS